METVNVSFGISNIPKKDTPEYQELLFKIQDGFRSVYELKKEDGVSVEGDSIVIDKGTYKYDANLLLNQLRQIEEAVESGAPSYNFTSEVTPSSVNYGSLKDLASRFDTLNFSHCVSKYGPHLEASDASSPSYYNKVDAKFENGDLVSQTVSHVEEDGSFYEDDVSFELKGDTLGYSLADVKQILEIQLDKANQRARELDFIKNSDEKDNYDLSK